MQTKTEKSTQILRKKFILLNEGDYKVGNDNLDLTLHFKDVYDTSYLKMKSRLPY